MSATKTAPVKWAQRKEYLYITISLADVTEHAIDLSEKKITFSGKSNGQAYALNLELVRLSLDLLLSISLLIYICLHHILRFSAVQGDREGRFYLERAAIVDTDEVRSVLVACCPIALLVISP